MNRKNMIISTITMIIITLCYLAYHKQFFNQPEVIDEVDFIYEDYDIYVDLKGEVKKPAVYKVAKNLRLFELIAIAGGFTENADLEAINLTQALNDGEMIIIPSITIKSDKININTAGVEELTKLTNIGVATANAIISYRNQHGGFKKIEDIMNVSGIGEAKFANIKDFITI